MEFSELTQLLAERGLTLTAAESLTGGQFQTQLAATEAASDVYPGGFITYSSESKTQLLGVAPKLIRQYGVVSNEVAQQMAIKAQDLAATDYAISFTGAAGPEALAGEPAGTVCIGLVGPNLQIAKKYYFEGEAKHVLAQTCEMGLTLIGERLV
ncbi:CinA family protein [Loigolactobacillus iwatensis]|uniref:CinA family protein n=1 Tax=Loigolactobacillus iwatensis TaxID=1267156 RepID=UPI000F7E53A2|nr:CinA family protein [Loigolactobacillus iwatensis]